MSYPGPILVLPRNAVKRDAYLSSCISLRNVERLTDGLNPAQQVIFNS